MIGNLIPFITAEEKLTKQIHSWIHEVPFDRNVGLEGNRSEAFLISLENKAF